MNFLIKAFTQKLLSGLPRSEDLNYLLQKYVTRSLPTSNDSFLGKFKTASQHYTILNKYSENLERNTPRFYEFGAGWDLIIPIAFSLFGVESQVIIDNRANARLDLVNDAISRTRSCISIIEEITGIQLGKDLPNMRNVSTFGGLLSEYGIAWLAPISASSTGLPSDSFDFISNTLTLEHIPKGDIPDIFVECFRILKPNGLMSCYIDLKDHYAYFDKSISIYNFLRYSDLTWSIINSSIHFQNRLRFPDYLEIIKMTTDFNILEAEKEEASEEDFETLARLKLNERYRLNYPMESLGVKTAWLVLRK